MKWKLDNSTGLMKPEQSLENVVSKSISRILPNNLPPAFTNVERLRENLALAYYGNNTYLVVKFTNNWRVCGIVTNKYNIMRLLHYPILYFREVYVFGLPIPNDMIEKVR